MNTCGVAGEVRDIALAHSLECLVSNNDRTRLCKGPCEKSSEDEHARESSYECGDSEFCYQCSLIETDRKAHEKNDKHCDPDVNAHLLHHYRRHGTGKTGYISARQVDVLKDQYECHSYGEHSYVCRLVKKIRYILCRKELAVCPDLEYKHDYYERKIHHIARGICLNERNKLLKRCHCLAAGAAFVIVSKSDIRCC